MPASPAAGSERTALRKRSVRIAGHRTSLSLEEAFWEALKEIAAARRQPVSHLIAEIDNIRVETTGTANLSSAVRVFVLETVRASGRTTGPAAAD